MEEIAGTITFGFISHFFGKLDIKVWSYLDKKGVMVSPPDALSSRTLRPLCVATLRGISREFPLGLASVCAVFVMDEIRRQQQQTTESSIEKENRASPSNELALQNTDLITSAMSFNYHLLKRETETHVSSWFGALTNSRQDQAWT